MPKAAHQGAAGRSVKTRLKSFPPCARTLLPRESNPVDRFLAPVSRALWRLGYRFEYAGGFTLSTVVDAASYRPTFAPWSQAAWREELRIGDRRSLVSPERRYFLVQMLRQTLRGIPGYVAECGVYRGGTAYLLARVIAQESPRKLLLFDTFAGIPETDAAADVHRAGDFADTGLADVQNYLREFPNVVFYPGLIPETFRHVPPDAYAFVHVDLDVYAAVRDATAYFYDRLD